MGHSCPGVNKQDRQSRQAPRQWAAGHHETKAQSLHYFIRSVCGTSQFTGSSGPVAQIGLPPIAQPPEESCYDYFYAL